MLTPLTISNFLSTLGVPFARFGNNGTVLELSSVASVLLGTGQQDMIDQSRPFVQAAIERWRRRPSSIQVIAEEIALGREALTIRGAVIASSSSRPEVFLLFLPITASGNDTLTHGSQDAAALHRYALSRRELEVARELASGKTAPRIATEFGVTVHTVRRHAEKVYKKLGVRTRAALVRRVLGAMSSKVGFVGILGAALPLISSPVAAQATRGGKKADYVYISLQPSRRTLDFTVDREGDNGHRKPLVEGSRVLAKDSDGINVRLEFLNPLRYTWKVSDSPFTSDLATITSMFFSAVNSQFGRMGSPTLPSKVELKSDPKTNSGAASVPKIETVGPIRGLVSWSAQFGKTFEQACTVDSAVSARVKGLANDIDADLLQFQPRKPASNEPGLVADSLRAVLLALINANDIDALRAANARATALASALDEQSTRARVNMASLAELALLALRETPPKMASPKLGDTTSQGDPVVSQPLSFTDADSVRSLIASAVIKTDRQNAATMKLANSIVQNQYDRASADCRANAAFLEATIPAVRRELDDYVADRLELVRKVRVLADKLNALDMRSGDKDFLVAIVKPTDAVSRRLSIEIIPRKVTLTGAGLDIEEDAAIRGSLDVVLASDLSTSVGVGVAISNVTFQRFGISATNDTTVVAESHDSGQEPIATVMFDFTWVTTGPTIGIQLGVGARNLMPVALAGISFRLPGASAVTLSAGALSPFNQSLRTLKPGDKVESSAKLESDIKYVIGRPSFYLGFKLSSPN